MTDDIHDVRTCLKKKHFCSSLFRVSAYTKFSDSGNHRFAKLLRIFSHPKFQTNDRNKFVERNTDNRIVCTSSSASVSSNIGLHCCTGNQKKINRNYDSFQNFFSFYKQFNISNHDMIDKVNNFSITHSLLSWLRNLFHVPKVYAAENESVEVKDESRSEGKEENVRNPALDKDVLDYLSKETGRDRLNVMFSKDHTGGYSPEIAFIRQVVIQSIAITFLVMSVIGGRHGREVFVMQNKPTVYKTRFLAFRKMHDVVFLQSMKAGAKWGFKITMFTLPFLLVSQSISVYRNRTSPMEYSVGGAVTGSILKFNLGLKGMFAGGVIGGAMGLVAGIAIWAGLKVSHQTQEDRHTVQIEEILQTKRSYVTKGKVPPPDQLIANPS